MSIRLNPDGTATRLGLPAKAIATLTAKPAIVRVVEQALDEAERDLTCAVSHVQTCEANLARAKEQLRSATEYAEELRNALVAVK